MLVAQLGLEMHLDRSAGQGTLLRQFILISSANLTFRRIQETYHMFIPLSCDGYHTSGCRGVENY